MDFHSLCQKIDVDNIRAKFPPLPAMPHIKLPKSMPKIKSRKIFRSSRESLNRNDSQKQRKQQQTFGSESQLAYPSIPHATFIKQTPTRISTISSLVHQDSTDASTYRSADSIEDDFFSLARRYSCDGDAHATMPLQAVALSHEAATAASNTNVRLSFTEKLHRSYKDLSEFRIKNIFAKKTVVRKDSIRVQQYIERYEKDLILEAKEQERRDNAMAENYTFRFKLSRQNTDHSNSITPDDSPRSEPIMSRPIGRTVGEHSGDESGMEATPPMRKAGIASTRFAKVRSPPLRQTSSELEAENEEIFRRPQPIPSSLWSTKMNRIRVRTDQVTENKKNNENESESESENEQNLTTTKSKFSYKERVRRIASYMSTQEDSNIIAEASNEATNKGSTKMLNKLKNIGKRNETAQIESNAEAKRKPPKLPHSTDEEQSPQAQLKGSPTAKAFNVLKHNFKRFQQSLKVRQQSTHEESGDEAKTPKKIKGSTKTEKLTSRLRRFRSRDVSSVDLDDEDEAYKNETTKKTQSPMRQAITHKLDAWKKSFRNRTNEKDDAQPSDAETSPEKEKTEKQKRSDILIKRIKHIRVHKTPDSKEELEATNTDTEVGEDTQWSMPKPTKFTEARQRTFKKVNEKMQQLKFFHKSQEQSEPARMTSNRNKYNSEEEDWDESPQHGQEQRTNSKNNLSPATTGLDIPTHNVHNTEPENNIPLPNVHRTFNIPTARAVWTTKPPTLSESMESDADINEFPRVLIHQDNSDSFESTLIIAVTRSPSTIARLSPRITEITDEKEAEESAERPKKPRRPERQRLVNAPTIKHARRHSIDSNSNSDSDSWMPENKRKDNTSRSSSKSSQAGLISIDERNEAWKVKTETSEEHTTLYKSKSIDIFEKNILKGGALTAFEDFDEELRNEPVLKIATTLSADSYEQESSEDTADDDNSSRITTNIINIITKQQYANSRESLIANFDENEENEYPHVDDEDEREDEDRPPSAAPSPPPKKSPPPPPLPQRLHSMLSTKNITTKAIDTIVPPPLPKSKPPLPPPVVKRNILAALPPRIPKRTTSITRAAKPLVKTSSLRLVFSEQVRPADVGKVNKLISRFEPSEAHTAQRPRIKPRRQQDDSEEYSDEEEDFAAIADKLKERYANIKIERDTTPTPTNTPKMRTPEVIESPQKINNCSMSDANAPIRIKRDIIVPMVVTTTDEDNNTQVLTQHVVEVRPNLDFLFDTNSNCSHTNSEYGSPLEYPSSLRSSMETIPTMEKKDNNGNQRARNVERTFIRSRRSMPRDDDNYYSFDSDEENSYYSISSTGSNHYVVEL